MGADKAAERLLHFAEKVKSGDSDNQEAQAAAYYFQAAFGNEFTRQQENSLNAHLNYGYTILRSAVARSVGAIWLVASVGIASSQRAKSI